MAKDFLGRELKVGDKVVCLHQWYRELAEAEIVKIMPVKIRVKYATGWSYTTQPCNTVKIQEVKE